MSSTQELREYIMKKSKYLQPDEYSNFLSLFDKIKINEDNEYLNIKEKADLEYRKGNYSKAVNLYSKYLEERPSSVILNNRSACFYKLKMYEECLNDCIRGLEIDKNYLKFYIRISLIESDKNNQEEAEKWIKKGLEIDNTNKILQELSNKYL